MLSFYVSQQYSVNHSVAVIEEVPGEESQERSRSHLLSACSVASRSDPVRTILTKSSP